MALVDNFLQIAGVSGESNDSQLSGQIQLDSWNWGQENLGSFNVNGGGGSGKVSMKDFKFSMLFNQASPTLFKMCATGAHIKDAKLTCRKAGGGQQVFLTVEFGNLIISSFETVGDPDSVLPRNVVGFNFETIKFNYTLQNADGSLGATTTAGYDLKKNTAT